MNTSQRIGIFINLKLCCFMYLLCGGILCHNEAISQTNPDIPSGIKEIDTLPPAGSLTDGMWLKGDLHVHSRHSKDSQESHTLSRIFTYAKSVGFGFICITDHDNQVLGDVANHTWSDPEFKSDSLLLLYGAEWTTTRGHGNAFSAKPYDHKRLFEVRDQRDTLIGRVKDELGIHLSANHPGGGDHFGFSYDIVESIEVWNSSKWSKNANAMMIWDDMLSSGRMLTGRGGSDAHIGLAETVNPENEGEAKSKYNYIGTPTTWVFTQTHTTEGVIDALTNGRVSVSANPYSPRIEFYADLTNDGNMDVMMGDNSKATGKPVKFRVQLSGNIIVDSTYTIHLVKGTSNGHRDRREHKEYQCSGRQGSIEFTDTPAMHQRTYYRVEVTGPPTPFPLVPYAIDLSGNMVGLSNPIYFNFDPDF